MNDTSHWIAANLGLWLHQINPYFPILSILEITDSSHSATGKHSALTDLVLFNACFNSLSVGLHLWRDIKHFNLVTLRKPQHHCHFAHILCRQDVNCSHLAPEAKVWHYTNGILFWGHHNIKNIEFYLSPLRMLLTNWLFNLSHPVSVQWYFNVVSNCIFLITNKAEYLFRYLLLAIWLPSLINKSS